MSLEIYFTEIPDEWERLLCAQLELGLRWLHDRAAEHRHRLAQRARQDPSGRWYG